MLSFHTQLLVLAAHIALMQLYFRTTSKISSLLCTFTSVHFVFFLFEYSHLIASNKVVSCNLFCLSNINCHVPDWTEKDMVKADPALWNDDWANEDPDDDFCKHLRAQLEATRS